MAGPAKHQCTAWCLCRSDPDAKQDEKEACDFTHKVPESVACELMMNRITGESTSVENLGIGKHCDYECLTILSQGEVDGWQVNIRLQD